MTRKAIKKERIEFLTNFLRSGKLLTNWEGCCINRKDAKEWLEVVKKTEGA